MQVVINKNSLIKILAALHLFTAPQRIAINERNFYPRRLSSRSHPGVNFINIFITQTQRSIVNVHRDADAENKDGGEIFLVT